MKTTLFYKKDMIVYIGGNPEQNKAPEITLELKNPQVKIDSNKNVITIEETK